MFQDLKTRYARSNVEVPAGGVNAQIDLTKNNIQIGPFTDVRVLAVGDSAGMVVSASLCIDKIG